METSKVAVIIGRFQPLHNGHLSLFKAASNWADKIIILIGSANQPRTPKNPWTWVERGQIIEDYISSCLDPDTNNYYIMPLNDHVYNDYDWLEEVQTLVYQNLDKNIKNEIRLFGHHKKGDSSNYYLDMFPQWNFVEIESENKDLEATVIRNMWFEHCEMISTEVKPITIGNLIKREVIDQDLIKLVPDVSYDFIKEFEYKFRDEMNSLLYQFNYYKEYPKIWGKGPFVTVDAAVFCCGHVLLIQRGSEIGHKLWALPGGFLNPNEAIPTGIVRELDEETNIKLPLPVIHGNMKHIEVFSAVNRSLRGRVITHCGLIVLRETTLPKVRAADDAIYAKWVPISEFNDDYRPLMFEDHFCMVKRMWSLVKRDGL